MKKLLAILLPLVLVLCIPSACLANAAAPPSVLIIVPNAPADLEITIGPDNIEGYRTDKVFESHFEFYLYDVKSGEYTVSVTTGDTAFELPITLSLPSYGRIFTLDLKNRQLVPGERVASSVLSVSLAVLLTLIIEGIVFFLFGYRRRISWLIFGAANLVTQGVLHAWLNVTSLPWDGYVIFSLILGEILVFIIEIIVFVLFVREHRRLRAAGYVIVANLLSLVAGGYLLTVLPH